MWRAWPRTLDFWRGASGAFLRSTLKDLAGYAFRRRFAHSLFKASRALPLCRSVVSLALRVCLTTQSRALAGLSRCSAPKRRIAAKPLKRRVRAANTIVVLSISDLPLKHPHRDSVIGGIA